MRIRKSLVLTVSAVVALGSLAASNPQSRQEFVAQLVQDIQGEGASSASLSVQSSTLGGLATYYQANDPDQAFALLKQSALLLGSSSDKDFKDSGAFVAQSLSGQLKNFAAQLDPARDDLAQQANQLADQVKYDTCKRILRAGKPNNFGINRMSWAAATFAKDNTCKAVFDSRIRSLRSTTDLTLDEAAALFGYLQEVRTDQQYAGVSDIADGLSNSDDGNCPDCHQAGATPRLDPGLLADFTSAAMTLLQPSQNPAEQMEAEFLALNLEAIAPPDLRDDLEKKKAEFEAESNPGISTFGLGMSAADLNKWQEMQVEAQKAAAQLAPVRANWKQQEAFNVQYMNHCLYHSESPKEACWRWLSNAVTGLPDQLSYEGEAASGLLKTGATNGRWEAAAILNRAIQEGNAFENQLSKCGSSSSDVTACMRLAQSGIFSGVEYSLVPPIAALSKDDPDQALALAKSINNEQTRMSAKLAILEAQTGTNIGTSMFMISGDDDQRFKDPKPPKIPKDQPSAETDPSGYSMPDSQSPGTSPGQGLMGGVGNIALPPTQ